MNKILVALDNSSNSQITFETALSVANSTGGTLRLLHVLSPEDPDYPILPTYAYYSVLHDCDDGLCQQKFAEYEQRNQALLQQFSEMALAAGIDAKFTQLMGNPGEIICELANKWSADLIVIGTRGLRGLKEMFLGSVSNYVTHHAPCSVLLVRQEIQAQATTQVANNRSSMTSHDQSSHKQSSNAVYYL